MRAKLILPTAVAAFALLAGASVSPAPATATATKACANRTATSIVLKRTARVLAYRDKRSFGAKTYACWRPTGRTMTLHTSSGGAATTDIVLDALAISGRVVAYHVQARGDSNYSFVRSFDVRTGKRLRRSGKFLQPRSTASTAAPRAATIATNANGAIVWLANGVLRAMDRDGSRELTSEATGAITAVAASERTARWRQGGAERRVRLA